MIYVSPDIELSLEKLPYSTTLEESLYLIQLGLPTTYHDMHYELYAKIMGNYKPCTYKEYIKLPQEYRKAELKFGHIDLRNDNHVPAWTEFSLIKHLTKTYTDCTGTEYTFKLSYSEQFRRFCIGYYPEKGWPAVEMSGIDIMYLLIQLYKFKIENQWPQL
jgi:hypothetical protein